MQVPTQEVGGAQVLHFQALWLVPKLAGPHPHF